MTSCLQILEIILRFLCNCALLSVLCIGSANGSGKQRWYEFKPRVGCDPKVCKQQTFKLAFEETGLLWRLNIRILWNWAYQVKWLSSDFVKLLGTMSTLQCRIQFLDDTDPFNTTNFPEPSKPPTYTFLTSIPLLNQIAGVKRLLKAPHKVYPSNSKSAIVELTNHCCLHYSLKIAPCNCIDAMVTLMNMALTWT